MGKQPQAGHKTKEAKAKAATQSSKSKGIKKKVDSRVREKANLAVFIDKTTYDKAKVDVPKMKLITVSTVSDRMKLNASAARRLIRNLHEQNLIKKIDYHHSQYIFTAIKE